MEDQKDFMIEDGVLIQYAGQGGVVEIPKGITRIGESAFAFHDSLRQVVIPEGVTGIGSRAFIFCTALTRAILPEGLKSIGMSVFSGCGSLEFIRLPGSLEDIQFSRERVNDLWDDDPDCDFGPELDVPYVLCSTLYAASCSRYPIYMGSLYDLVQYKRPGAVRGYFYALEHGLEVSGICKEEYLMYIRGHREDFHKDALASPFVLQFLTREGLLMKEEAVSLMDRFAERVDWEGASALLQYLRERFGGDGTEDLSL